MIDDFYRRGVLEPYRNPTAIPWSILKTPRLFEKQSLLRRHPTAKASNQGVLSHGGTPNHPSH